MHSWISPLHTKNLVLVTAQGLTSNQRRVPSHGSGSWHPQVFEYCEVVGTPFLRGDANQDAAAGGDFLEEDRFKSASEALNPKLSLDLPGFACPRKRCRRKK